MTTLSQDNITNRLTPYSINSAAKVEYQILNQGHWYDSLRIAENIICEKSEAIEHAYINRKEQEDKIFYQETHLQHYPPLKQIEILADIDRWIVDQRKQERLIEDARFEMDIALRLKRSILAEHPEALEMNYSEIQQIASYDAYIDTKAEQLAVSAISAAYNLPSEIFEFLLKGDDDCISRTRALMPQKIGRLHRELPKILSLFDRSEKTTAMPSA